MLELHAKVSRYYRMKALTFISNGSMKRPKMFGLMDELFRKNGKMGLALN